MNKLFFLTLILSVSACNSGGGAKSTKPSSQDIVNKYSAEMRPVRGLVENTLKSGKEFEFDATAMKFSTVSVLENTTSVIIKIDGDDIYKYVESKILSTIPIQTTKKVVLEKSNPAVELNEILQSGKGKVIGDFLSISDSSGSHKSGFDNFEFEVSDSFTGTIDLKKPYCSSRLFVTATATVSQHGQASQTETVKTTHLSTCGVHYTSQQMKDIDLASIEFCDESDEENYECQQAQNLEFLTDDI